MNEEFIAKVKEKIGEEEFESMSDPVDYKMIVTAYQDNKILDTYNFMPEQFRNSITFKEYWGFYKNEIMKKDDDSSGDE